MPQRFVVRREQLGDNEERWAVWDESTQKCWHLFEVESEARLMSALYNALQLKQTLENSFGM